MRSRSDSVAVKNHSYQQRRVDILRSSQSHCSGDQNAERLGELSRGLFRLNRIFTYTCCMARSTSEIFPAAVFTRVFSPTLDSIHAFLLRVVLWTICYIRTSGFPFIPHTQYSKRKANAVLQRTHTPTHCSWQARYFVVVSVPYIRTNSRTPCARPCYCPGDNKQCEIQPGPRGGDFTRRGPPA